MRDAQEATVDGAAPFALRTPSRASAVLTPVELLRAKNARVADFLRRRGLLGERGRLASTDTYTQELTTHETGTMTSVDSAVRDGEEVKAAADYKSDTHPDHQTDRAVDD